MNNARYPGLGAQGEGMGDSQGNHSLHKTKGAQHDIPRVSYALRLVHISAYTSRGWRYGYRIRMHRPACILFASIFFFSFCGFQHARVHHASPDDFRRFLFNTATWLRENIENRESPVHSDVRFLNIFLLFFFFGINTVQSFSVGQASVLRVDTGQISREYMRI